MYYINSIYYVEGQWDEPGGKSTQRNECLYTPWLCTDHLVVLARYKKKVAPLAKQFPQPPTTHDAAFSPLFALTTNNAHSI
jgi:hypothetical protein